MCKYLLLLFLFISFKTAAQFTPQTQPTQPTVLIVNTKPAPNQNGCVAAAQQCVDTSQYGNSSPSELFNAHCGFDYEYFQPASNSGFPCNNGSPPAEGESLNYPINCYSCTCPAGQLRIDGICVIDQGCSYGIQDFITGACFSPACPYGDGTPQNCGLVPSCVSSENASLIPATFVVPATCVCPFGTAWNSTDLVCATPLCNGFDNSPFGSIFDLATNQCECSATAILNAQTNSCVETVCQTASEIYSTGAGQCVVGLQCERGYDLNTNTNTCYKVTNDTQQCSAIFHNIEYYMRVRLAAYAPGGMNDAFNGCWVDEFGNAPTFEQCGGFTDQHLTQAYITQLTERTNCALCVSDPNNFLDLVVGPYDLPATYSFAINSCKTEEDFCASRNGTWNIHLDQCLNGNIQDLVIPRSSSSSSSRSSSSLSSSIANSSTVSSDSASSINSSIPLGGGGAGGSTPSDGGGGDSGGGGGDSGGGGGGGAVASAASQASVANSAANSVANSFANSSTQNSVSIIVIGTSQASVNNSTANSISNNSTAFSSQPTNCVNGICGGANTSTGTGGGGGGGSNTSSGTNNSTAASAVNNSSAGAGECDPTAKNYDECMGRNKIPTLADTNAVRDSFTNSANNLLDTYTDSVNSDIENATSGPSFKDEPNALTNAVKAYFPQPVVCSPIVLDMGIFVKSIPCDWFNTWKLIFAWVLSIWVVMDIYALSMKPVEK